jgi:hypothetical protein
MNLTQNSCQRETERNTKNKAHFAVIGDGNARAAAGWAIAAGIQVGTRVVFCLVHAQGVNCHVKKQSGAR